jgi:hypothetical protein
MSIVYAGSAVGDVVLAYTIPEDSDGPPRAADVAVFMQGSADDIARLSARTSGGSNRRCYASFNYSAANGTWSIDDTLGCLTQISTASPAQAIVPLDLPHGSTIDQVEYHVKGFAGHAAPPAVMPAYAIVEQNPATGVTTTLLSTIDPSGSAGLYELNRSVTATVPGSVVVDRANKRYFARVGPESGLNSLLGFRCFGVSVRVNLAALDKGAG